MGYVLYHAVIFFPGLTETGRSLGLSMRGLHWDSSGISCTECPTQLLEYRPNLYLHILRLNVLHSHTFLSSNWLPVISLHFNILLNPRNICSVVQYNFQKSRTFQTEVLYQLCKKILLWNLCMLHLYTFYYVRIFTICKCLMVDEIIVIIVPTKSLHCY